MYEVLFTPARSTVARASMSIAFHRVAAFRERYGLRLPILEAPIAGACPPELAAAVAQAGGMGALGAMPLSPDGISEWVRDFRALGGGPLQINLWIPDPPAARDRDAEARIARFLEQWGPPVSPDTVDVSRPDFAAQCEALLDAQPTVVSSIMGLLPECYVRRLRARASPGSRPPPPCGSTRSRRSWCRYVPTPFAAMT
jgi:nitronate monooxygenase